MEAEAENNDVKKEENSNDNNNNNNNNESNSKIGNSSEGLSKPKRQMKTPFQLETLEKAYAVENYPSETMRVELSEKLGLSDRQLQMWFCHRRLKDKKELPSKKPRKAAALPDSPVEEPKLGPEVGVEYGSGSGSGSSPFARSELRNVVPRGYYESPQTIMELRAIACVEAQLGEPLREDGPILGVEFDPLPPDAFGAPLAVTEQQKRPSLAYDSKIYERHDARANKAIARTFHEYPFLPNQSGIRSDVYGQLNLPHLHDPMDGPTRTPFPLGNEQQPRVHAPQSHSSHVRLLSQQQDKLVITYPSPPRDNDVAPKREPHTNITSTGMNSHLTDHPIVGQDNPYALAGGQVSHNDAVLRMERKRKSDETKVAKEVEAYEMRMRKELEKQDNLRRKSEERMRKEMERQDRERRKEEERLMREKQREEERSRREQRREMERREKFLLKEHLRAEKRRQKEEIRKEKEEERRKAALEKANARRIAKESMELIEDEQLELMELAAASKGLSSIIHIDLDTLQNLESFRDSLCIFPPKSVKLRKPFAIQPWIDSEQNIGNLLMVWRFLITFADVLDLWPFTLDEFVQAFHDYDSRLLGEIHVVLLKVIIKDIEDVARTPSTGLGMNQNGAANPGGGHPEIVEGAYAWGFDIRNWQKNLNQLTWPEVFRQLALSAGLGPQLKKRNITWSYAIDKDEGKSCKDIISTLRNGSAAESAVAKMQERGLLAPRRSRHRLTPGTVKFAAFHVLSLEGSKGLTVLELAEKIQKSGLRDLTTSKTPEASISVALTRDTKLFERIAPSTYCVRDAFRKNPADADSILSEARKKIQIFENGFLAGEDADDVEREEESESDEVDEDPEDDDLVNPSSANQNSEQYEDTNICSSNGKENLGHNVDLIQKEFDTDLPCFPKNGSKDADCPISVTRQPVACEDLNASNLDQDNMEIDESKSGESWILGLTEGEYSDLSVEERLNALVALVGVANEGNSIRVVLEELLQILTLFERSLRRDFLSLNFSTTDELLGSSSMSERSVQASTDPESVAVLPWVPLTTAALSLRLFEIDSSISYVKLERLEPCEEKEAREYIKLPSRYTHMKSNREVEPAEFVHDEFTKDKSVPKKIVRNGNKRGRGTNEQGRGKKLAKRVCNSKRDGGRKNAKVTDNLSHRLKQQARGTQGQGAGRGRRTIRKRRMGKRAVEDLLLGHTTASHSYKIDREPVRNLDEEWDGEKASPMTPVHIGVAADNSNSAEEVESDDDNAQAVEYDQGNWEVGFNGVPPNRWSRGLVGMSDEDVDAFEELNDNGIEENEEEDSEADVMSEGSDGIPNTVVNVGGSDSALSEDSSD
ncbi:hypothetical protein AAZV13_13G202000 [Glycine max]